MGETPSLTGEDIGETHRVLEHTQTHPPRSAPEQPSLFVGSRGSTESSVELSISIVPSLTPSPIYRSTMQQRGLSLPGE